MGKRGPRPTPTKLKIVKGSRVNGRENEPQPEPGRPGAPWTAKEDKDALQEWQRVVPLLESLGLLAEIDRAALVAYCESWSVWQQARRIVEEEGPLHTIAAGTLKEHPALRIARDARRDCIKFASMFGATPSSRSEVSAAPAKAPNPFSTLKHGDKGKAS